MACPRLPPKSPPPNCGRQERKNAAVRAPRGDGRIYSSHPAATRPARVLDQRIGIHFDLHVSAFCEERIGTGRGRGQTEVRSTTCTHKISQQSNHQVPPAQSAASRVHPTRSTRLESVYKPFGTVERSSASVWEPRCCTCFLVGAELQCCNAAMLHTHIKSCLPPFFSRSSRYLPARLTKFNQPVVDIIILALATVPWPALQA